MALSNLLSRLERDALSRVEAIREKADADVRAIEADAERAARETTARHLECGDAQRQVAQERVLAQARRQAGASELEACHAQLARILNRAHELIPEAAASPAYAAALPAHLAEALAFLHGLRPRVRCRAALAPVLQLALATDTGAELVVDESVGSGFVAEAGDGSVVVDDTLAARLAGIETRLGIEFMRRMREIPSIAPLRSQDVRG